MELYNQRLCLTQSELVPDVMSKSGYDYHVNKGNIRVARFARGLGHYALIDYDSLPQRFKDRFIEVNGADAHALMAQETATGFTIDEKARAYYSDHLLPTGEHLSDERIEEYTLNASVMEHTVRRLEEMRRLRKAGHNVRTADNDPWVCYASEYEDLRKRVGHTLPCGIKSLKNKLTRYKRDGYASLVSGKLGNANTAKITDAGGRYLVALRMSKRPVYDTAMMLEAYNEMAAEKGWKPLSGGSAITSYLNRPEVIQLWYGSVYGELKAKQRFGRKQRTLMPTLANALWYGDGTRLNLFYRKKTSRGWVASALMVYEVIDAMSEVFLGFCISEVEDFESQYKAFRMAVETALCKPYEIVVDNQGGQKKQAARDFFGRICRVFRHTMPRNPQSKTIEQIFGRFQAQVLAHMYNFTGTNITALHGGEVNMEFLQANVMSLPQRHELEAIYAECRRQWNNAAHPAYKESRLAVYERSVNPECEKLTDALRIRMFWAMSEESTFTDSGITITIDGRKYSYEPLTANGMPDMDFRSRYTFAKFRVQYDPLDLSTVRLYETTSTGDLRFVTEAKPYIKIHRAMQEQTPAERSLIRSLLDEHDRARVARQLAGKEIAMEWGTAAEQQGLRDPGMGGMSAKRYEQLADEYEADKRRPNGVRTPLEKELSLITPDQLTDGDWVPSSARNKM